jgi:1-acyl-sn-glycerol-3-phosphate acyltransferase
MLQGTLDRLIKIGRLTVIKLCAIWTHFGEVSARGSRLDVISVLKGLVTPSGALPIVRSLFFDVTFYLWTFLISVISLPALVASQRATIWISELWTAVSLLLLQRIVGLSHEVRGRDNLPNGAAIVAIKHQSAWDTVVLWSLLENPAIVLKRSLTIIPVFGWYMRRGGAIAIDRAAGAKALKAMVAAARLAAAEGRPIAIFPEGTRTPVGVRQRYQPGVAALYMHLGLPIVPIALNSGLFWGRRSFVKRPGRILVKILPPIEPGLNRHHVMAELERRIEQATATLVAETIQMHNTSDAMHSQTTGGNMCFMWSLGVIAARWCSSILDERRRL